MTPGLHLDSPAQDIARLTLANPGRRNVLSDAMWAQLPALLGTVAARVLIVTGHGEHFSAGGDIAEFPVLFAGAAAQARTSDHIETALNALATVPVPTVAAVRGICMGGGAALAVACDVRFADAKARFAVTPAKLGLVYPSADIARLIATVGMPLAKDMLLSSRPVGADEALATGLVKAVVDDPMASALDYAQTLLGPSAGSQALMKSMIADHIAGRAEPEAHAAQFAARFEADDFRNRFQAFLNRKR